MSHLGHQLRAGGTHALLEGNPDELNPDELKPESIRPGTDQM